MNHTTHTTKVETHRRVAEHIGKYDTLQEIIEKRKPRWFGHVIGAKGTLMTNSKLSGKDHK